MVLSWWSGHGDGLVMVMLLSWWSGYGDGFWIGGLVMVMVLSCWSGHGDGLFNLLLPSSTFAKKICF